MERCGREKGDGIESWEGWGEESLIESWRDTRAEESGRGRWDMTGRLTRQGEGLPW